MTTEDELLGAVADFLQRPDLPPPAERARLREAAGVTQSGLARLLKTSKQTVGNWEAEGRSEPRPPRREPYRKLLEAWAEKYPAQTSAAPETFTGPTPAPAPVPAAESGAAGAPAAQPPALQGRTVTEAQPAPQPQAKSSSRRPAAKKATRKPRSASEAPDPRFENGPLLVLDASEKKSVQAYGVGGLLLDVPAKSLPALIEWALDEARVGAPRLNTWGQDADPLLVLTAAACERYGLPPALSEEEQLERRLAEDHKSVRKLLEAGWQLTQRGFGPWARVYQQPEAGRRRCVQLCLPSWGALDEASWGSAGDLAPAELIRVLGTYAQRVMTPVGPASVTGLNLMTALRPPTKPSEPDEDGKRHPEHNPGSLGNAPMDPAPCEAINGHPLLADLPKFHVRTPAEKVFEEAYDWTRDLTDEECERPYLVGIDTNLAFAAAANGATVGLATPPEHLTDNPTFDKDLPGSWLVDLSHVDLSRVYKKKQWHTLQGELLPSPFTPSGETPAGPAWYATPTVAYALELGYDVAPLEAWVRREKGKYLDPWYKRHRDAYIDTMRDLGVEENLPPQEFLDAMKGYQQRDPHMALVAHAVKASVKHGIGKLRERARGGGWKPGQPWPALSRPTWRPDIRDVIISRARINLHRKMVALALATGQYPVSVLSDCAVYPSTGPSPLDVLPYTEDGTTIPGSFRLGVNPGMVKHEGTQSLLWGAELIEQHTHNGTGTVGVNLARYIKTGTAGTTGE